MFDRFETGLTSSELLRSNRYWHVVRGWLGFSLVMTVLGLLLYAAWLLTGTGLWFLLAVTALFLGLFRYSTSRSSSIRASVGWFSEPDGILLVALLFALTVSLLAIIL